MKVLLLRTCDREMKSFNGDFKWPESGLVEAPDWGTMPACGGGLHGLLWGEGDGSLLNWDEDAKWLVFEADSKYVVNIDCSKAKAKKGKVVYCGNRKGATDYILAYNITGRILTVVGAMVTVGDNQMAIVGYKGIATAGNKGVAIAGDHGKASAGNCGTATAGYKGIAIAGHNSMATVGKLGTATVGNDAIAIVGDNGRAIAGYNSTAIAGDGGTAMADKYGKIQINWWDGNRYRLIVGHVGENGIEANKPYIVHNGKLLIFL